MRIVKKKNQNENYGSPVAVSDGAGEGGFGLLSSLLWNLIYDIFGGVVLVGGRFLVVGMKREEAVQWLL
jgi:hypothetical protein